MPCLLCSGWLLLLPPVSAELHKSVPDLVTTGTPAMSLPPVPQVLRVFLEADGNLRSNPSWRALKPNVLTPTQVRHTAQLPCSHAMAKQSDAWTSSRLADIR